MSELETAGREKARGRGSYTSARRIRAGHALLTGAAKTATQALVEHAGYSASTARNPRWNGLAPEQLMREAAVHSPESDSIAKLKPQATRRLRRILEDENEASAVVAQTALAVFRVAAEVGDDGATIGPLERLQFRAFLRRALEKAFAVGWRARDAGRPLLPEDERTQLLRPPASSGDARPRGGSSQ